MDTNNSRIRKEIQTSGLELSRVYKSDFQKRGTLTAELKQKVKTKSFYPSQVVANNLQDNIFSTSDFGFGEKEYESVETRVAWIDVPENATVESVQAQLAKFPKANLYKILSNRPIVSDTEANAINNPEFDFTLDMIANRQIVRYPESHDEAGEIALDSNNKPQYRRIAFSISGMEDQDLRTNDAEFYASPEIAQELQGINNSVISGQELF